MTASPLAAPFAEHIATLQHRLEATLSALKDKQEHIEAVLLHSGPDTTYFADDQPIPFRPYPHFAHWLPVPRPLQMVLLRPGQTPIYFCVEKKTYWNDLNIPYESWWADAFEVIELDQPDSVIDHLPATRRIAFLGDDTGFAGRIGLPSSLHNHRHLRNRLDYLRSLKTPYEIECIRAANRVALPAHDAARRAFEAGGSEWDIHCAYLAACSAGELDMPYPPIVGLGEKAGILHYEHKRREPGHDAPSLLVDAGYAVRGYAADITRTTAGTNAPAPYPALVDGVDAIKREMIAAARAGVTFQALNQETHTHVVELLIALDILRGDPDELREKKISTKFFPHGLGHMLGLQVHDVSGLFKDESGILEPPPEEHKELRLTRALAPGMVITIEPGIYFIPLLLDPEREGEHRHHYNFTAIDALYPCGGAREEDNILITDTVPDNLTLA